MQGDLLGHDFGAGRFDLVYSIGVLAEHAPLQPALVSHGRALAEARRAVRVFDRASRIGIGAADAGSAALGSLVAPLLPGARSRRPLRDRLLAGGLYADEARVEELLAREFAIESLERVRVGGAPALPVRRPQGARHERAAARRS